MMNMQDLDSKESLAVKFKREICAKLGLKPLFERDWYFDNVTESRWFWKQLPRNKPPRVSSLSQFEDVTLLETIAEVWAVISNLII